MRFINQIEALINQFLFFLGRLPIRLFEKVVPLRIRTKVSKILYNLRTVPKECVKKAIFEVKNLPSTIKKNQAEIIHFFHLCIAIVKHVLEFIQNLNLSTLENGKWRARFRETLAQIKHVYISTRTSTFVLLSFALVVGSLAVFQIYTTAIALYKQNVGSSLVQKPHASIARRPAYHDRLRKSLYVTTISIPFTFETAVVDKEVEGIQKVIIDIEVETSNRYLAIYLSSQDHVIKDYLNQKLEPILATFPLTQEGKRVIRGKIIEELNNLIKQNGASGTVENVYIVNITIS